MYEDQREELRFIFGNEKNGGAVPKQADSENWNENAGSAG